MYQPFPCYPSFSSFFVTSITGSATWEFVLKALFFLLFNYWMRLLRETKPPLGHASIVFDALVH